MDRQPTTDNSNRSFRIFKLKGDASHDFLPRPVRAPAIGCAMRINNNRNELKPVGMKGAREKSRENKTNPCPPRFKDTPISSRGSLQPPRTRQQMYSQCANEQLFVHKADVSRFPLPARHSHPFPSIRRSKNNRPARSWSATCIAIRVAPEIEFLLARLI